MTKAEIKKAIEIAIATLNNGESTIDFAATAIAYGGNVPYAVTEEEFAATDFEDTYKDADGEECTKMAVIISKDENGKVTLIADNGQCYTPVYTVEEFAEVYADSFAEEYGIASMGVEKTFDELQILFNESDTQTPDFAAELVDRYFPNIDIRDEMIEELMS